MTSGPSTVRFRLRRRRVVQVLLIIVAALVGVGSRRFGSVLPAIVARYAGDMCWALAVYLTLGFLWPELSVWWTALVALGISLMVETSQLYHAPWIDAIRGTTVGGLLLGFDFTWIDLPCYAAGVAIGVGIDASRLWLRGPSSASEGRRRTGPTGR